MRRLLASGLVAAALLGLSMAAPAAAATWIPQTAAAQAYAQARAGSVSFAAIGTDGVLRGSRAATRVPAASVLKVMFLTAYLRQASVRDRALTSSDRALLEPMIRESANAPATAIANQLGPGPLYALADAAGMQDFSYTRPWGLSTTSARDQARFMLDLPGHLPARHRAYALRLLTEIVPSQRWGIGQVPTPTWTTHFKGGWGSGTGATDHQVALLEQSDGTRVSVAVMTTTSPSHAYGMATLEGVFSRLLATLPDSRPRGALDVASGGPGTVHARGWALDVDAPREALAIRFTVGGEPIPDAAVADGYRPDVGQSVAGAGDHHGFVATFATARRGRQEVCAHAVGVGPGGDRRLGCRTVTITDPGARCMPTGTTWHGGPGRLASGTSVTSFPYGRIDVFGVGGPDRLYQRAWTGSSWTRWLDHGHPPGVPLTDTPAAVTWRDRTINVYARGADGAVWQRFYEFGSGWSSWSSIGGVVEGGIAAVALHPERLDVFAIAGPDRLYQRAYVDGSWTRWIDLGRPAETGLTRTPGAVVWQDGVLNVYARGADGAVWQRWWRSGHGWSAWTSIGGRVDSGPTVVSSRLGRVDVFAAADDRLFRRSWEDGAWTPWLSHGAPAGVDVTGEPGAAAWGEGRVDTFPTAADGAVWQSHHPCVRP